jgi:hypothetical protein
VLVVVRVVARLADRNAIIEAVLCNDASDDGALRLTSEAATDLSDNLHEAAFVVMDGGLLLAAGGRCPV